MDTQAELDGALAWFSHEPFEHLGNGWDLPRLPERFFGAKTAPQNDTLFVVILERSEGSLCCGREELAVLRICCEEFWLELFVGARVRAPCLPPAGQAGQPGTWSPPG